MELRLGCAIPGEYPELHNQTGEIILFAVLFTDKPWHSSFRAEYLQSHIYWIDQNKHVVLVAGSLRIEPQDSPKGGLWIVEAKSKASVMQVMATDPFYLCGLRQNIEVLHWSKALEHHQALV